MTWDQEEQQAIALGSLLQSASAADDQLWLDQAQKRLMTVVSLRSAAKEANFPATRTNVGAGKRRKLQTRSVAAGLLVAAGALLAVGFSLKDDEEALTFTIKDEKTVSSPQEVGRVRSPQTETRTLEFSDGSKLKLAEGGSVRVRETDEHGAEVVIENGRLDSSVKHLKKTSWSVFAGPYEIQVIGTKFSTEWDPGTQRLVVLLDEGSVRVVGSDIEDHVALKPGQRFEAAPRQAWKVTAQTPPEVAEKAVGPASSSVVADSQGTSVDLDSGSAATMDARGAKAPATSGANWPDLLRDGKNGEILSDAKRLGLPSCYSTCSVPRLRALADAARYTGEVSIARDALTHLRSRSPGESARAGYLLGSLSEARGQAASALTWYDTYLSESPAGPFAAEARAGKMRAYHALGRHSDAQSAASEYLRLYPRGSSATIARRILDKR